MKVKQAHPQHPYGQGVYALFQNLPQMKLKN